MAAGLTLGGCIGVIHDGSEEHAGSPADPGSMNPWSATEVEDPMRSDPLLKSGAELYAERCATCHGELSESTKRGKRAIAIRWALGEVPDMAPLRDLVSDAEVDAIAYALNFEWVGTCAESNAIGRAPLGRLTDDEYQNAVRDLLGIEGFETVGLPPDRGLGGGLFSTNARDLEVFEEQWIGYWSSSEAAVALVDREHSEIGGALAGCEEDGDPAGCVRSVVAPIMRRAYRRAIESEELDAKMALFESNAEELGVLAAARLVVRAILLSPEFLFKNYQPSTNGSLDSYQLASRLAFLLWRSVPDDALLEKAESGALEGAGLEEEARRMLADPRGRRFIDDFFRQWTTLGAFTRIELPGVDAATHQALAEESRRFFAELVAENAPVETLLLADFGFQNELTAAHYEIPFEGSEAFERVPAPPERHGFLTQASFLGSRESFTSRGEWILEELLCRIPSGPPQEPEFSEQTKARASTFRERLAIHIENPDCRGCHAEMDPFGLALDVFGPTGKVRATREGGDAVDTSGELYGESFDDFAGMAAILLDGREVTSCLSQRLFTYSLGRYLEMEEKCAVNAMAFRTFDGGGGLADLIVEIVESAMFARNGLYQGEGE